MPAAVLRLAGARRFWTFFRHYAIGAAIISAAWVAMHGGMELRRWAWDDTQKCRFTPEIANGFSWGHNASRGRYSQLYDSLDTTHPDGNYGLDYPPLRLLIMTRWFEWHREHFPTLKEWSGRYDETEPLLTFNTCCELAGAVGMFLLVRWWVRRFHDPELKLEAAAITPLWTRKLEKEYATDFGRLWCCVRWACGLLAALLLLLNLDVMWSPAAWRRWEIVAAMMLIVAACLRQPLAAGPWRTYRPAACAMMAALLFWFNPAVIWEAHCWPQWDVWPLPFFLFAALLASQDYFLPCGILLALGAMLKGQMLLAAPVLLLWPLLAGRPGAFLRGLFGVGVGVMLAAWPWLTRPAEAIPWLACVIMGLVLAYPWPLYRRIEWGWRAGMGLAIAPLLILWPALHAPHFAWLWGGIGLALAGIFFIRSLPVRKFPGILASGAAACALLSGVLFTTESPPVAKTTPVVQQSSEGYAWTQAGVETGIRRYRQMTIGQLSNLPALLERRFEWRRLDDEAALIPAAESRRIGKATALPATSAASVSIRSLLIVVYLVGLLLCGAGTAIHGVRGDVRVLIAMAAPWLIFACVLPQMHERYLIWAAALSAMAGGVGVGMTLVHMLITGVAWMAMASSMLSGSDHPQLVVFMAGTQPGIAWLVMLLTAIWLFNAVMPRRGPT